MTLYSMRQAARKLGIDHGTLSRYISAGKLPAPSTSTAGGVYLWTEEEIENLRQFLPKIANGRKTRYKKKQAAKTKTPPRARSTRSASSLRAGLVPHRSRSKKKK